MATTIVTTCDKCSKKMETQNKSSATIYRHEGVMVKVYTFMDESPADICEACQKAVVAQAAGSIGGKP